MGLNQAVRASETATAPQDVIVIGAGVVGMATALTLIDRGHRVTVVDAAEGPGLKTSYANGGQLSYAYTDALASPAILAQLPRLVMGCDPAFRLRVRPDAHFIGWAVAFLRNTTPGRFRRNTVEGLALALQSRRALHRLAERHQLDFLHAVPGKLHLLRSTKAVAATREVSALKSLFGVRQRIVDPDEALAIEPGLGPVRAQIAGALYSPDEEVGEELVFAPFGPQRHSRSSFGCASAFASTRPSAMQRATVSSHSFQSTPNQPCSPIEYGA